MDKSIVPVNRIAVRSSTCYEFSNPNEAVVVEIEDDDISVGIVEKQIENLKLNYQFSEKDVPQIFQALINDRISGLKVVHVELKDSSCLLRFDKLEIHFERKNDNWTVTYEEIKTMIEMVDPEKSIIDHLWFVLKNPNIKLKQLDVIESKDPEAENRHSQKIESKKFHTILQSMLDSINHLFDTRAVMIMGLNEDTFLSMLKHVKPGRLEEIMFILSWKEAGNYRKLKEIVGTDQWKQAKEIYSAGVIPIKIQDVSHCNSFLIKCDSVDPKDVLYVIELFIVSTDEQYCMFSTSKKNVDFDAIMNFLRSQNDGSEITKAETNDFVRKFSYNCVKSGKLVNLFGNEKYIGISNH